MQPASVVVDFLVLGRLPGPSGLLVALLFARADASTFLVARLQPLRIFQIVTF